jgi:hypothetical protein
MIEGCRIGPLSHPSPPEGGEGIHDRIVVGVDPPAGVGEGSDACGIVVAGSLGETLYVLEDASVRGLSPEGWANRVAAAAARWDTPLVVAEANNGGEMVRSVLHAADLGLKVRLVHASKGKSAGPSRWRCGSRRAGPISPGSFASSRMSSPGCRPVAAMKGRAGRPTAPTPWSGR